MQMTDTPTADARKLKRVLKLWDLIIYGIVAVTPSAPVTIFGLAYLMSRGHVINTILFGMVGMVLTAISYGRMAGLYPSSGSAYAYVGYGLNPYCGFVTGWAMLLSYIFCPLFCTIYGSLAFERVFPQIPYVVYTAFFAGTMTFLNLRGVRTTARASEILVGIMMLVLLTFIGLAIRFVVVGQGAAALVSSKPFFNPETFELHAMATAISFAGLTFLGFDSVTALAEDVENPKRNIILATVSVCVFTGIFGGLLVYLAQLVWPDYQSFTNIETAFMDVTRRVGGTPLFHAMGILLILANIGAGLTSHVVAARILYGMGRDNIFPRKIFAYLDPKRNNPTINIWIIGILAFVGAQVMTYQFTAELLIFGSFLGFMGVNLATIWQFYIRKQENRKKNFFFDLVVPGIAFAFCMVIWINLATSTKIAGGVWFAAGITYLAFQTRGFRKPPVMMDFSELE